MAFRRTLVAGTVFFAVAVPAPALAATGDGEYFGVVLGAMMLVASVFLLIACMALAKVSEGSAMSENIRWVVLSALCLAAHALTRWVALFMPDAVTGQQAALGSDGLVILALVFLCVYFYRVRWALARFAASALSEEHMLAEAQLDEGGRAGGPGERQEPVGAMPEPDGETEEAGE